VKAEQIFEKVSVGGGVDGRRGEGEGWTDTVKGTNVAECGR
jgi:hypothetical protein